MKLVTSFNLVSTNGTFLEKNSDFTKIRESQIFLTTFNIRTFILLEELYFDAFKLISAHYSLVTEEIMYHIDLVDDK